MSWNPGWLSAKEVYGLKCAVLFHKSSRVGGGGKDDNFVFALVVAMMKSRMKGRTMKCDVLLYWLLARDYIFYIVTICDCLLQGDVLDLDMWGELEDTNFSESGL